MIFGEYMGTKTQNTLTYDRIPDNFLLVFDVMTSKGFITDHDSKKHWCDLKGLECVPEIWNGHGKDFSPKVIEELLQSQSILGGPKIEGIVVKNYDKYFDGGKYSFLEGQWMVGKFVRKEFQEMNMKAQRAKTDTMEKLKQKYNVEPRWDKAIQKSRDEGKLVSNMKDMRVLISEVLKDVEEECSDDIREELFKLYGKTIIKSSVRGLAEYYNKKLLESGLS